MVHARGKVWNTILPRGSVHGKTQFFMHMIAVHKDSDIALFLCTVLFHRTTQKLTTMPKKQRSAIGQRQKSGTGRNKRPARRDIRLGKTAVPKDAPVLDSNVQNSATAPTPDNLVVSVVGNRRSPASPPLTPQ